MSRFARHPFEWVGVVSNTASTCSPFGLQKRDTTTDFLVLDRTLSSFVLFLGWGEWEREIGLGSAALYASTAPVGVSLGWISCVWVCQQLAEMIPHHTLSLFTSLFLRGQRSRLVGLTFPKGHDGARICSIRIVLAPLSHRATYVQWAGVDGGVNSQIYPLIQMRIFFGFTFPTHDLLIYGAWLVFLLSMVLHAASTGIVVNCEWSLPTFQCPLIQRSFFHLR